MAFLKFNKSELVNLNYSLKREIISANKTGAYCNTTIVACNTRRYHGLLTVPIEEFDGGQYLLLSSLEDSIIANGKQFNLGIHCYGDIYEPKGHKYVVDFNADPVPEIKYKIGGIILVKKLLLSPDRNQVMIKYELRESLSNVELQLKPFLAFRNVHSLTRQNPQAQTEGQSVPNGVAFKMYEGFPYLNLQMSSSAAKYKHNPYWYNGITYSDEYRRGFECKEDLLVPGSFSVQLKPGDSIIFSASVQEENPRMLTRRFNSIVKAAPAITSYHDQLVHCADLLKQKLGGQKMINAGFSWLYRGLLRETILSLPGLTLYADGNKAEFEEILDNLIADEQERLFRRTTQIEAPLYIATILQAYIDFGADEAAVWAKYGSTIKKIIESYTRGNRAEVTLHPNGLLWAQKEGAALTWMNAYVADRPVTERAGYQVETNALWYNTLCFALEMEGKYKVAEDGFIEKWEAIKNLCLRHYQPTFWYADGGYLADYADSYGQNLQVRPNQLAALFVKYPPVDEEVMSSVFQVITNELLTKRGIRTLSPRDINYKGVYEGNQSDRDLAYHQGSTSIWMLYPYVKVAFWMKGPAFYKRAEWLCEGFFKEDLSKHGVGAFSELYDGDPPHEPHGAISSALSTSALLGIDYLMKLYKEDKL